MYELRSQGYDVEAISFNYGQRHGKELTYASGNCKMLGVSHDVVDITSITSFISNSALTSPMVEGHYGGGPKIDVPEGHYAQENMALTVVPNRNMIMLAIACGIAVNRKLNTIGIGVHAGDHFIYPDCRPGFIEGLGRAMLAGNEGFHNFYSEVGHIPLLPITAPFIHSTKADIAYRALELGVPLHMTWSCYKGGDIHCGRCGTCVERLEAIDEALKKWRTTHSDGIRKYDATVYKDSEYWKVAVAEAKRASA
jgi:7-cyano-7-deazaguanine synthase